MIPSKRSTTLARAALCATLLLSGAGACKGKGAPPPPAAPAKEGGAGSVAAKPASDNPVVAELAPLWVEIAKCTELSDLYAQAKCPANFQLLETVKAANAAVDKNPKRLGQVHEALVEQVVHGTSLKARTCAAYADWSKGAAGGKAYEGNLQLAQELLGALKKLDQDDQGVGYGIANMLSGLWRTSGEGRKSMLTALQDKTIKAKSGRPELLRHAGWVAKDTPEVLSAIRAVATDTTDELGVRQQAISALGGVARDKPELVEPLLFLSAEPIRDIQVSAIGALGNLKAGTPEAKKAQGKLLELLNAPEPNALAQSIPSALGKLADLEGLAGFTTYYRANAAKPGVTGSYSNLLYAMAFSGRFKNDAPGEAALRKGIDTLLQDKQLGASDRRYTMDTLGALGGASSVASCKKYEKDADASVAAASVKCVQKASAPRAK